MVTSLQIFRLKFYVHSLFLTSLMGTTCRSHPILLALITLIIFGEEKRFMKFRLTAGMATGYGLGGRGSIPSKSKIFCFSVTFIMAPGATKSPVQWVPEGLIPQKQSDRGVKLTTHHQLLQRSRMVELYIQSHIAFMA
jgi:hypothetical protein